MVRNRLIITEEEKSHILKMYDIIKDFKRPLEKLMECKFTADGKYVIFEGRAFSCETGEQVPINEGWSLSDILHTGADILSMGMDFVIPGSGAVIDILNGISYVIEAQFKNDKEKDSLYVMAVITFAFVLLPGPLQSIAPTLKKAVKKGTGMASKVVVDGLKIIGGVLDTLLLGLPSKINQALKSPLAKNILGSWGDKISGFINNFTTRIKQILNKITGKTSKEGTEKVAGQITKTEKEILQLPAGKAGKETFEKGVKEVSSEQFEKRFSISNWIDGINNLFKKLPPENMKFSPSNVKVLSKSNVASREVIEVEIENGQKILFYKSSGANVATTGKESGEWFVIPGFRESDGWFIKTTESVELTKGGNKYLTDMAQFLKKNGSEGLSKTVKSTDNLLPAVINKTNALSKIDNVVLGNNAPTIMSKLGLDKGFKFNTTKGPIEIGEIVDTDFVVISTKLGKQKMKVWSFLKTYIVNPSINANKTGIPLITKTLVRMFNDDGTVNQKELVKIPTITPEQTKKDMEFLSQSVAEYQGSTRKYTVNPNALNAQKALKMLGYDLGTFGRNKDGIDGKFGPKTMEALKKFQTENNLKSSIGKLDRYTARKLSELLKSKNIQGSEEVQNKLNSI